MMVTDQFKRMVDEVLIESMAIIQQQVNTDLDTTIPVPVLVPDGTKPEQEHLKSGGADVFMPDEKPEKFVSSLQELDPGNTDGRHVEAIVKNDSVPSQEEKIPETSIADAPTQASEPEPEPKPEPEPDAEEVNLVPGKNPEIPELSNGSPIKVGGDMKKPLASSLLHSFINSFDACCWVLETLETKKALVELHRQV